MSNICFECKNAYAHECEKIRTGIFFQGSKFKKGVLVGCPNFVSDRDHCEWKHIKADNIAKMLKINTRKYHQKKVEEVVRDLVKLGYLVRIDYMENGKKKIFIKEIRK